MQPPFHCDYGRHIHLGEKVFFNFGCVVLDVCEVRIGSFTLFGPGVQIYAASHPMDAGLRRTRELGKAVTIGSRTVIGAGSVVTRDVPEDVVAAGNPCRVLRRNEPGQDKSSQR